MQGFPDGIVLEDAPCPNGCNRSDEFVLEGEDLLCGIEGVFHVVRCQCCGLERTNPRPTAETIGAYYPGTYSPYTTDSELPAPEGSGFKKRLTRWLELYARQLPEQSPGVMLEIGCSTGRYMEYARARGWLVEGVEYSEEAANTARAKGFFVSNLALEAVSFEPEKYDLVAAWMVLEHLHDPISVLEKIGAAMLPGGRLIGSVPEVSSLARIAFGKYCYDLSLPTHLYHFSTKSLQVLLEKAGWEVERVIWQRNCQTLLKSTIYWADDKQLPRISGLARWMSGSPRAGKLRALLNIVLGITHLSGRIEFWAKRKKDA